MRNNNVPVFDDNQKLSFVYRAQTTFICTCATLVIIIRVQYVGLHSDSSVILFFAETKI